MINHRNTLPPSIVDTQCLSMSSIRFKALCIVINFLVFWSIYVSSSLVHVKNDPEYFIRVTAQVLIIWKDFCCRCWFWKFFLIFWGTYIFLSVSLIVSWLPIYPRPCNIPSLQVFSCFPDFIILFLSLFLFSHVLMSAWHTFSKPDCISIYWLYILLIHFTVSSSFTFLAFWLTSSMYTSWITFSRNFGNLLPTVNSLGI